MSRICNKTIVFILVIISVLFTLVLTRAEDNRLDDQVEFITNNNAIYHSNRFTQVENNLEPPINPLVDTVSYELIAESETLKLYLKDDDLSIRIENKETGYIWGSSFNTEEQRLNKTWRARVNSAVWISYFRKTNTREEIGEEAITTSAKSEIYTIKKNNGFESTITFGESGIQLKLIVSLEGDSLNVTIPSDSIIETENNKIGYIKIYPFLGAVKATEDEVMIPGYVLIPDGTGALIRYEKPQNDNALIYSKDIYGSDKGLYDDTLSEYVLPEQSIHFPIYGMVHGVNHNAFYATADSGAENSRIVVYPAGRTTDFYWSFFEFIYRIQYEQPTSKNMGSVVMTQKNRNDFDASVRYEFLNNEKANYVGIANQYREHLKEKYEIQEYIENDEDIPIRLEILNSEHKKGLLFDSQVLMSDTDFISYMVDDLRSNDIENMRVVLRGWSKGGYTGSAPNYFPFDKKTGGSKGYNDLINKMNQLNIPLYFQMDYIKAFSGAGGYNSMTDLARKIGGSTISGEVGDYEYHLLKPSATRKIFNNTLDDIKSNNINYLALEFLGQTLYSSHGRKSESRSESIEMYRDMLEGYDGKVTLYSVNDYLLQYISDYLDTPIYSSQHLKFSDTVPFIPLVLRGLKDAYAPFTNNFSDIHDENLRLVDYGIYPSFYLTEESAHLLIETPSNDLYSSKFSSWKNTIVEQYQFVNNALKHVQGEYLVNREVLEAGVVKNTYSNGVVIYINYLNNEVSVDELIIPKNDYIVIGGGV